MFDRASGGLGSLFGFVGDALGGAVRWAWDTVITGIYTYLANGLALLTANEGYVVVVTTATR
ncbi:MAG: hypothetical protein GEV08_05370 [Acidimicrobiia bacterium]|nr:hypothetical protein [Acidimicrobiia bacterium]